MFDEEKLENITMEILQELEYKCINGYEMERTDFSKVLLEEDLLNAIERMNKGIEFEQIQEVIRNIRNLDNNNTILNNKQFTQYLLEGVKVPIQEDGTTRYKTIKVIDFNNIEINTFKAINQYTIIEESEKRPDIIVFINGMPLVVIELKSTTREEVKLEDGYNQLKGYQNVHIPTLFYYNQFLIVSDGVQARAGTITSPWSRFSEWKKIEDTDVVRENMATHNTLFNGMMEKDRIMDIINNFIMWSGDNKILAAYHQYFGVKKAIKSTEKAYNERTGKAGILWHTQGSGKSFSMVFYSANMIKILKNPSIVVVTDRNDLDDQLFNTFSQCSEFLKQKPVQIESRADLNDKLENRISGGIFFTTLQKFEEETGVFSKRDDILVLVDEAHRSHYGIDATMKFDKEKMIAYKKYGTAKYLHTAFPNATYIGFTGTPVETKDKSTSEIFGNVIDTYDMTQAILDGATVPIMYEARMARVGLNQKILDEIDDYYTYLEKDEGVDEETLNESKKEMAKMQEIIEDPDRLELIVKDIIKNYSDIENTVANKAMVVAYSRRTAYTMYKKFLELKPEWKNKIHMVITSNNKDDEEMQKAIGSTKDKHQLEKDFKDYNSEFKIAIVVDMWLTGFDVPELDTIYIDKPIQQHTLIQTISRVNRVCEGKDKGLIVDYIGIKKNMNLALKKYTNFECEEFEGVEQSITIVKDQLEVLGQMSHNFNSNDYFRGSPTEQLDCLNRAVEYVQLSEELETRFMAAVKRMKQAFSLCSSSEKLSDEDKDYIHFYCAVRSILFKLTKGDAPDISQMNARVREMLEGAIQSDGIEELFETGKHISVDIFSDEYMDKINAIQLPNTKIKILQRLLSQAIDEFRKVNKIMGVEFADRLKRVVDEYNNRRRDEAYANEVLDDVAEQLAQLLEELKKEKNSFKAMGIDYEEKAFYDILKAVARKYEFEYPDDKMLELSKRIKVIVDDKSRYTDWSTREDIKANLQVDLILLLDEFGYPPVTLDDVYKEVLEQAENFKKYAN